MILIVDDKAENIFSLRKLLELHGFSIDSANSGEEALKKILKQDYALIILDVQMPGMDGFEVADAIAGYSKSKDIPIIFLSAVNTDKRFVTKGYSSGGMDYITKPVDPDILIHKVRTLYNLTKQQRELNLTNTSLTKEVEVRKMAEEELNERVQELRSILESMPQVAFTTTPTGEIEFVNEHWYLYSASVNRYPEFHPDDRGIMASLTGIFETGQQFTSEVRLKNLITGEYRYHLLKLVPVRNASVITKWVGSFTDIHEQKCTTEELERSVKERTKQLVHKNEELESINHELQQFAFVASHDLKEPLRKIQLFSSMLEDALKENAEPGVDKYIDRIKNSSQRMTALINDLLDYSRLSVDALFQQTNLNDILNDIVTELEYLATEKNARFHIATLPVIDAIPAQMRQVFQNLVMNSLKFAKADVPPVITVTSERTASLSVDAPTASEGDYCRITFSDNGIGFNEKHIDKIFALFQRLNAREQYEGTGIGLAIAKKIITKHNGSITAKGIEGEGATFIITLPVKQKMHTTNQTKELI